LCEHNAHDVTGAQTVLSSLLLRQSNPAGYLSGDALDLRLGNEEFLSRSYHRLYSLRLLLSTSGTPDIRVPVGSTCSVVTRRLIALVTSRETIQVVVRFPGSARSSFCQDTLEMFYRSEKSTKNINEDLNPICKISGVHGGDYEKWCLLGCYAVWLL
jgi:hypothetical protein